MKKKGHTNRRLKVYEKYIRQNNQFKKVPEIRLCGRWLHEQGFHIGDYVEVVCDGTTIILTISS